MLLPVTWADGHGQGEESTIGMVYTKTNTNRHIRTFPCTTDSSRECSATHSGLIMSNRDILSKIVSDSFSFVSRYIGCEKRSRNVNQTSSPELSFRMSVLSYLVRRGTGSNRWTLRTIAKRKCPSVREQAGFNVMFPPQLWSVAVNNESSFRVNDIPKNGHKQY